MEQKPKRKEADENRRRNFTVVAIILVLGLFFAGLSYYNFLQNQAMAAAPIMLTLDTNETATPTLTATATGLATFTPLPTYTPSALVPNENRATSTPSPLAPEELENDATETPMCFFNWAYGPVPENHVVAMRESLDSAGYNDVELETLAYGEDQICMLDDEIVSSRFGLMDFTPTISINVDDETFNDPTTLGPMIRDVLVAITETADLPRINKIELDILSPDDAQFWMMKYQDITTALTDEISDDALYELGLQED